MLTKMNLISYKPIYVFEGWLKDCDRTGELCTLEMRWSGHAIVRFLRDKSVSVTYEKNLHLLNKE